MSLSEALTGEIRAVAHDVVSRFGSGAGATQIAEMTDELIDALTGFAEYVQNEPKAGDDKELVRGRLEAIVDDFAEAVDAICNVQSRKMSGAEMILYKRRRAPAVAKLADRTDIATRANEYRALASRVLDPHAADAYRRLAARLEQQRRS